MSRHHVLILILVLLAACSGGPADSTPAAPSSASPEVAASVPSLAPVASAPELSVTPSASPEPPETLIAAGDIAACDRDGDSMTAALVAELDGVVATLGDNAYPNGSDETFAQCYDPVWGAFLERTRPAVGNHDLQGDGGAAYFRYFGERAGIPGEGWYSYDIGDWHVVALNSNCELIACDPGSDQHEWLVDDLAASDARCTLAYMHHPRFSSGPHGDYPPVAWLWEALDAAGTELLLVGHDHLYERFGPQSPLGVPDPSGVRQITVGTGGYDLYRAGGVAPNSELIIDDTHGVLELTLRADSYGWRFLTVVGTEADAGSGRCH